MFLFYNSKQTTINRNYYKGTQFEILLKNYLQKAGFDVNLRRKKNSLEYDIEGKNIATDQKVIGEAKAHEQPISGKDFSSFVGKLIPLGLFEGKVHGLFLSTSPLSPEADDYYEQVKRYGITSKTGRELYKAIESALNLPSFEILSNKLNSQNYIALTSSILTTDSGIYIVLIARAHSSGTPAYFSVFDQYQNQIVDKKFINQIASSEESLQSLTAILPTKIENQVEVTERAIPKGLTLGKDWADYRLPASPEVFIGRKEFLTRIKLYIKNQETPNVIQIKSRSGVGKSSVLAFLEKIIHENNGLTEVHDARDIKSIYDFYSIVQRFTQSKKLAHDFRDIEEQIKNFVVRNPTKTKVFLVDQFESTFIIPEVFYAYETLASTFSNIKNNIYLLFARKSDQLTTYDDSRISIERLNQISQSFELPDFAKEEAIELISKISDVSPKPIGNDVQAYVLEFAQGFPWLLKRTMAHLIRLLNHGTAQGDLFSTGLRLDDLFNEELEELDELERDYLTRIASRLPADYNQLQRFFDEDPLLPKILDKLTRSRLLRLTGSAYDTYNDVFKDYLVYQKLPEFRQLIIYRMYPSAVLSVFHDIFDINEFSVDDLESSIGLSRGSMFNAIKELRNFNLVKPEGSKWKIPQIVKDIYNQGRLGEYIRRQLLENEIVTRLLNKIAQGNEYKADSLPNFLQEQFPFIEASNKTWRIYSAILRGWLTGTKLIVIDQNRRLVQPQESRKVIVENLGNLSKISSLGRRQPPEFFLPDSSRIDRLEKTLLEIQEGKLIEEIKDPKALRDLRNGGWLEDDQPIAADREEFRELLKSAISTDTHQILWNAVKKSEPLLPIFKKLTGDIYTEETHKWRLKTLLRWAKELEILPKKRIKWN